MVFQMTSISFVQLVLIVGDLRLTWILVPDLDQFVRLTVLLTLWQFAVVKVNSSPTQDIQQTSVTPIVLAVILYKFHLIT